MCTVNMTFEVPESKIDIEALKKQVRNYVGYLISVPGLVWKEDVGEAGWEPSPELQKRLEKARQEIREGECTVLHSKEDINAFFDSL